jgi:hypothetical protein
MDIERETNFFAFFNVSWNFLSFQKKIEMFTYTCLYVISYKCKYVLFHLNMLILLQKIFFLFLRLN